MCEHHAKHKLMMCENVTEMESAETQPKPRHQHDWSIQSFKNSTAGQGVHAVFPWRQHAYCWVSGKSDIYCSVVEGRNVWHCMAGRTETLYWCGCITQFNGQSRASFGRINPGGCQGEHKGFWYVMPEPRLMQTAPDSKYQDSTLAFAGYSLPGILKLNWMTKRRKCVLKAFIFRGSSTNESRQMELLRGSKTLVLLQAMYSVLKKLPSKSEDKQFPIYCYLSCYTSGLKMFSDNRWAHKIIKLLSYRIGSWTLYHRLQTV